MIFAVDDFWVMFAAMPVKVNAPAKDILGKGNLAKPLRQVSDFSQFPEEIWEYFSNFETRVTKYLIDGLRYFNDSVSNIIHRRQRLQGQHFAALLGSHGNPIGDRTPEASVGCACAGASHRPWAGCGGNSPAPADPPPAGSVAVHWAVTGH